MCGIAAVFGMGEAEGRAVLQRLLSRMSHRGEPQFQMEVGVGPGWAVGTNRLAITTEPGASQPLRPRASRGNLVFNGEVYSGLPGLEEARTDGSIRRQGGDGAWLAEALAQHGRDALPSLEAMFALVWVDDAAQEALLARDRFGIKPLYLGRTATRRVLVASEIKALAGEPSVASIEIVPPGSSMRVIFDSTNPEILEPVSYFSLDLVAFEAPEEDLTPEGLQSLLRRAVAVRSAFDGPVGVYLSGGVDSSCVLCLALEGGVRATPIVVGAEDSSDRVAAEDLCRQLGVSPVVTSCPSEDALFDDVLDTVRIVEGFEPNLVRQSAAQRVIAQTAAQVGLKVVLCGEGADELFCGYPEFGPSGDEWHRLRVEFLRDLHRTQLQRVDRMSMHFTTEVRVPFLDSRVVSATLRSRSRGSFLGAGHGYQTKALLRRAVAGVVPDAVRLRPKVVLSEGVGLRGNDPKRGMFQDLVRRYMDEDEARRIRREHGDWMLASDEEALYFREFHRLGYSKATFMRERVRANASHSLPECEER